MADERDLDRLTAPSALATLLTGFEMVDLSHTLQVGIPTYPTHARFGQVLVEDYDLGDAARHYQVTMDEHNGTHMDAPLHFIPDGPAHYGVDEVPLERLSGRAATIAAPPDLPPTGLLGSAYIRGWEEENGPLMPGDRVLLSYGWEKLWTTGREGRRFVAEWPGLSGEAAEYLVSRGVSVVGCDTLAVDASTTTENPAHYALLGSEVYIIENLKNLTSLPPFCFVMAFPLKMKGGSGSPVRAVALVPRGPIKGEE